MIKNVLLAFVLFGNAALASPEQLVVTDIPLGLMNISNEVQSIELQQSKLNTTQFLILTGGIKVESEGEYCDTDELNFILDGIEFAEVKGGRWQHKMTAWRAGRVLQVWHRILDKIPENDGFIRLKALSLTANAKLIQLPGLFEAENMEIQRISEPEPLILRFTGTAPFLVIMAANTSAVSDKAMYSYGYPLKTHVYVTQLTDFTDPSLGDVAGVVGKFSLVRRY